MSNKRFLTAKEFALAILECSEEHQNLPMAFDDDSRFFLIPKEEANNYSSLFDVVDVGADGYTFEAVRGLGISKNECTRVLVVDNVLLRLPLKVN